jgi:hypothetical protein
MDLDFALLCDGATARPDGKLDLYGAGLDTIQATAVPVVHNRLVLATRVLISRMEAEHPHRLDVTLQGADGQELARARADVPELPEGVRESLDATRQFGLGLLLNFENTVFPAFETYQFVIQWDGNEARPPLRLFVAESPAE